MDERQVLNLAEAGKILGLPRTTVFAAVKRGEIPHIRIGRRLLIPRIGIQRMLEQAGDGAGRPKAA